MRLMRNFGENYSMEGIRKHIFKQSRAALPLAEPPKKSQQYLFSGKLKSAKKITGFRALYFHYCYLLGIFPKNRSKSNKRLHFLLRKDLLKLDAISQEAKPLAANRIDTVQQLVSYKEGLEVKMLTLTDHRKELYRSQRTTKVKSDSEKWEAISAEISSISKQLSQLRREEKLCDDIAIRSGVMREKIQAVRSNARPERRKHTMYNSDDATEQIVRISLEGTEVALKLTSSMAKNIAAALYAMMKNRDKNKIKGRQH